MPKDLAEEKLIDLIRRDKKAINNAKRFLIRKNLDEKIDLKVTSHMKFDLTDFNIVFILYGIKNKEDVFSYISMNMNEKTKIIYRISI